MEQGKTFVLLVCSAPYTYQGADTALRFAQALIKRKHHVEQVFFYHDGVYVGSSFNAPEQAERNLTDGWAQFGSLNKVELVLCSNSAMKRGILDDQFARQNGLGQPNLNPQFKLAGLGQFVDAVSKSDRLVSFGQVSA